MYIYKLFPIIIFISFFSSAKEATSIVIVNGTISIPTCLINGNIDLATGLSQTIDLGSYTTSEVSSGKTKKIDVPLIIDCSKSTGLSGISLELSTLGNYGAVGGFRNGVIKTSLDGISIYLQWKNNNHSVDLSTGAKKYIPNTNSSNIFDGSINARVLPIVGFSSNTIEKGRFRSGINVTLSYY
ncbi:hypothetical protein UA38_22185 [Photobacterium kishitanii]|uniref:Fimbrial-type adhesion domain-containing protein n=1 Tax=Photobacterium kishitanii TaxID=318456 RepID=A0AAX0YYU1_9GAMM|nr:fimbrial protein [Photobacterium kishitanii]KJG54973.1 hypothetical protein UA38_22185 [Photobacterium kishitanii]PSW58815.1 hypothetical protein C0W54_20800 [Photobacterium kishitanii]PSX20068.1 hypothetical protein C0W70_08975 [Photobacterium kishitanii]PSX25773.1 hypothetical protein C0W39_22885 [Photobacterium kishitanii]PSX29412.1 hypothetical protein C0W52_05250 [Photobacterium kishitanii]